eukprot:scaffold8858_cov144-Skeletonema_menzelii.AAC.2
MQLPRIFSPGCPRSSRDLLLSPSHTTILTQDIDKTEAQLAAPFSKITNRRTMVVAVQQRCQQQ